MKRATAPAALPAAAFLLLAWLRPDALASEVFITGVEVQSNRVVPTPTKLAYVWADQGFAVHVPLDVELWLGPAPAGSSERERYYPHRYRIEVAVTGFAYNHPPTGQVHAEIFAAGEGAYGPEGPVACDFSSRTLRHRALPNAASPRSDDWDLTASFRDVRRGGKRAVWIYLDPSRRRTTPAFYTTAWNQWGDSVTGGLRIRVHQLAAGREPEKLVFEKNLPLQVRQNAWVLRGVNSTLTGAWGEVVHKSDGREWSLQDLGAELRGGAIVTRHRRVGRPVRAGVGQEVSDYEVRFELPPRIPDDASLEVVKQIVQTGGFTGGSAPWSFLRTANWQIRPWPVAARGSRPELVDGGYHLSPDFPAVNPATNFPSKTRKQPRHPFRLISIWDDRSWTAPEWPTLRAAGSHPLLIIEEKYKTDPQTPGQASRPPVRRVEVSATRLSDLEDNRIGNTMPIVADSGPIKEPPDDGFAEWIVPFVVKRDAFMTELDAMHVILASYRADYRTQRNEVLKRMRLLSQGQLVDDTEADDFLLVLQRNALGQAPPMAGLMAPRRQELLRAEIRAGQNNLNALRAAQVALVDEAMRDLEALADEVNQKAGQFGDRRPYVTKAAAVWSAKTLLERIRLCDSAGLRREMRTAIEQLGVAADSVTDHELKFQALIFEGKLRESEGEAYDEQLETMRAQGQPVSEPLYMAAQRMRMLALFAYKAAGKIKPADPQTIASLQQLELFFLRRIFLKVQAEKDATWEGFKAYMDSRGFSMDQPDGTLASVWECVRAFFGTGPQGIAYQIEDKAGAQSEQTSADHEAAMRDLISLDVMMRLRSAGLTLAEIRNVTGKTLQETLAAAAGNQLKRESAERFAHDIHATFTSVPELTALLEGDEDAFRLHFANKIYPAQFEDTWPEWTADWFNAINVGSAFLGGSIAKVGSEVVAFQVMRPGVLGARAAGTARVTTSTEVIAGSLVNSRYGARFLNSEVGRRIAATLAADQKLRAGQSTLMRAGNTGSSLLGVLTLYCGVHVVAHENNLPALARFADAIFLLGGAEIVRGVLDDVGIRTTQAAQKIQAGKRIVEQQAALLDQKLDDVAQLERIIERRTGGATAPMGPPGGSPPAGGATAKMGPARGATTPVARADRAGSPTTPQRPAPQGGNGGATRPSDGAASANNATARVGGGAPPAASTAKASPLTTEEQAIVEQIKTRHASRMEGAIPGLDTAKEGDILLTEACDAIASGNPGKASRHASASRALAENSKQQADALKRILDDAAKVLETKFDDVMKKWLLAPAEDVIARDMPVPVSWTPPGGYPDDALGIAWQKADELFAKNKLDDALKALQNARSLASATTQPEHLQLIERRMGALTTIKNSLRQLAAARRRAGAAVPGALPIDDVELAAVQAQIDAGIFTVTRGPAGANPTYVILENGQPRYIFKNLGSPGAIDSAKAEEMAVEEFAAQLMNVPGLHTRAPAARKLALKFKVGDLAPTAIDGAGMLARFVQGDELYRQRESVLYALKHQYLRTRAISLLLGDPDRHVRNCLVGNDGFAWAIDFGNAHLHPSGTKPHPLMDPRVKFEDEPGLSQIADFARDLQLIRFANSRGSANQLAALDNSPIYNWTRKLEEVADYDVDLKPVVDQLKRLVKDNNGQAVREMLERSFQKLDASGQRIFKEVEVVDATGQVAKKRVPEFDETRVNEAMDVLRKRVDLLEPILRKKFPPMSQRKPGLAWLAPRLAGNFALAA